MKTYRVLGLMSGTSLDGLDIADCIFRFDNHKWLFEIKETIMIPYTNDWINRLKDAPNLSGFNLIQLDKEYGVYLGNQVKEFLKKDSVNVDFVASHGHTVFHQPSLGVTFQIGNGSSLANISGLKVINDFRSLDVALGGQGAPLVPIGDKLLFGDFDACLNLGGFANISFEKDEKRIAFDICPVNILLNKICEDHFDVKYDDKGKLSESGEIDKQLLQQLNDLPFYTEAYPKSLGKEWVDSNIIPLIEKINCCRENLLRTVTEHIALQLSNVLSKYVSSDKDILVTGGGTYNSFLIERIKQFSSCNVIIPEFKLIDFKEALIFAFLGVLRTRNEINCLASVTGALKDSSGGIIHEGIFE